MKISCGWLCVLAGAWLIVAPYVLGYSAVQAAMWNDIILGLTVIALGLYMCFPKKAR